jgi:hypothetical protein
LISQKINHSFPILDKDSGLSFRWQFIGGSPIQGFPFVGGLLAVRRGSALFIFFSYSEVV